MVGVLKRVARGCLEIAACIVVLLLLAVGARFLFFLGQRGLEEGGRLYARAAGTGECRPGARSVSRLFEALDGGALPARRRALRELRCAEPMDFVEFDRLALAARGQGRRRLRAAAVEALSRARAPALKERAARLAADADEGLAAAAFAAAKGMGVREDDPLLAPALAARPNWAAPRAGGRLSAEAAARFSARAVRSAEVVARADLSRFNGLAADARRAAASGDMARVEALLEDPDFIVGGATAGEALAGLGNGFAPRAAALVEGDDPVLSDVGRGFLMAVGRRVPGAQVQGRGRK